MPAHQQQQQPVRTKETEVTMDTVRLTVIETQLANIGTAIQTLVEKNEALIAPLQDQAIRIARVESKVDDLSKAAGQATTTGEAAHRRVDVIDKRMAYVQGGVSVIVVIGFLLSWSLKDQLELARQLPVLIEKEDAKLRSLEEQDIRFKEWISRHEQEIKDLRK